MIKNAWIRITKNSANNAAAYLEISNLKNTDIQMIGANSKICNKIEIHKSITKDNITKMIKLSEGVVISKNSIVKFEPGSYHLMLMKIKYDFDVNKSVPIKLFFKDMKSININFKIVDQLNLNHSH